MNMAKYPDVELDRIAEGIWNDSMGKIIDRDTFDEHFAQYISKENKPTEKQKRILAPKVFKKIREINPEISKEKVFTKARGKDLHRDRQHTAKTIVTTQEEYKRRGADEVDLKGYDTKITIKHKPPVYRYYGKDGERTVLLRKTFIVVNGKRQARYRDRRGKFRHRIPRD